LFNDKISAIIGAGIGGASTAHFLRKDFGPDADITIFEKGQVGFDPKDSNRRAKNLPFINKSIKNCHSFRML
jgi:glycine/D-amino acid oxidase-like deaminating enzyme